MNRCKLTNLIQFFKQKENGILNLCAILTLKLLMIRINTDLNYTVFKLNFQNSWKISNRAFKFLVFTLITFFEIGQTHWLSVIIHRIYVLWQDDNIAKTQDYHFTTHKLDGTNTKMFIRREKWKGSRSINFEKGDRNIRRRMC